MQGSPDYKRVLCEERHERIETRLCKHGEQIDSLEKCTIKLTEMVERYDQMAERQYARIDALERKPGQIMERAIGYALSVALGALASALLGYFLA